MKSQIQISQSNYPSKSVGVGSVNVGLITANVINQLKEELLQTWETYLIPDYHRTVFLDCIYGLTP